MTPGQVLSVALDPADAPACPEAVTAVMEADWVVLGPGSWFTSVIPHLLVPDLATAIINTPAQRILVLNIAPADETDGVSASRHIELLAEHAPGLTFDVVIADERFAQTDQHLEGFVRAFGGRLIRADVAARDGSATHDRNRLAAVFSEVIRA